MATYRRMSKGISLVTFGLSDCLPLSFQDGSTCRVMNCSELFTLGSMGDFMERINQDRLYHPPNSGMKRDEHLV